MEGGGGGGQGSITMGGRGGGVPKFVHQNGLIRISLFRFFPQWSLWSGRGGGGQGGNTIPPPPPPMV